jgi:Ni/Fe-hydrogenase subunit HybB-like protein
MAVEPDWISPEYGLLLASAQATIAVSVALLLAGGTWRRTAPEQAATILLLAAATWVFLQFMQFLVIWSADKPADIVWYLQRANRASRIVVWIGVIAGLVVPLALLLSPRRRRQPTVLPAVAVLVLGVQALGMLWLITPSLRHHFAITGMDLLELAGIGGVTLGICLWFGPLHEPAVEMAQHGR